MITIEATRLNDAVRWAMRGLPAKPTAPVMAGMVLSAGDAGLTVSAWDWDVHASSTVGCDGELDRVIVSGRTFADVVAKLDGPVTIELDGQLHVRAGRNGRDKFRLPVMDVDEYPQAPSAPDIDGVASDLPAAVARAAAATDRDPKTARTALRTVLVKPGDPGFLRIIGTDAYHLHIEDVAWDGGDFEPTTIFAAQLNGVMKDLGPKVELGFSGNLVTVIEGDRVAIIGKAEVDYFKAEQATAQQLANTVAHVDVERADLASAIGKAALFCNQNQPVLLDLSTDAITVRASNDGEGAALVDAAYDGPERTVAIVPTYLTEAVASVAGPVVRMRLYPPEKPSGAVFFEGLAQLGGDPDASRTHFVMSIRNQG